MRLAAVWAVLLLVSSTGGVRADGEAAPIAPTTGGIPVPSPVVGSEILPTTLARPFPPDIVPTIPDSGPPLTPPSRPTQDLLSNRLSTPFATQTAGGGFQGRSFNEEFDGDFAGVFYSRRVQTGTTVEQQQIGTTTEKRQVGTRQVVVRDPATGQVIGVVNVPIFADVTVPVFGNVTVPTFGNVTVPVAGLYSGVMITDNDSPRPRDRLYFSFSYYDGLGSAFTDGNNITMTRELAGFEKTLFNGNASVGLRLPFIQVNAPFGNYASNIGDMSLLFKWAVINNRDTGDLLSLGFVLTMPTSPAAVSVNLSSGGPIPHSTLFQPWVGFVRMFGDRGYMQYIGNAIIPSDSQDTYILGNSFAFGYRLLQGEGLRPSLTPTFEAHVRTPLNNRDPNGLIYLQDQLNLTTGVHLRWSRVSLSGAACIPVISPRPWNIEAIANLNILF
jgi:hypothetical protein